MSRDVVLAPGLWMPGAAMAMGNADMSQCAVALAMTISSSGAGPIASTSNEPSS